MSDLAERVRAMPCVYAVHGDHDPAWVEKRMAVINAVARLEREASVLVRSVVEPYPYNPILGEKPGWVAVSRSAVEELKAVLEAKR